MTYEERIDSLIPLADKEALEIVNRIGESQMKLSKPIKKDRHVGDIVVAKVDEILLERFQLTTKLRLEAQAILIRCNGEDRKTWEDAAKEYDLPEDREYRFLPSTGEIAVAGYRS